MVSIRGRLLMLAVGAVVPLSLVALAALWEVWGARQQQLNEAMEQQTELAAGVFERWLDTQQQPLLTVAAVAGGHPPGDAFLRNYLHFVMAPRPHWIDIRIVNANGESMMLHPVAAEVQEAPAVRDDDPGALRRDLLHATEQTAESGPATALVSTAEILDPGPDARGGHAARPSSSPAASPFTCAQ